MFFSFVEQECLRAFLICLGFYFFFKSPLPMLSMHPHGLRCALKASFVVFHKPGGPAALAMVRLLGASPMQAAPRRRQAVQLGVPSKTPEGQRQVKVSGTLDRMAMRSFFERKDPFSKL